MPTETQNYAPGTFCWIDLSTTDVAAATKFYGDLFGWTVKQVGDEKMPYAMFLKGDKEVCGMVGMPPNQPDCHPAWMNYVAVEDCDASVKLAEQNGGQVMMPTMDAMGAGRMAILGDPSGAAFALWQPLKHKGAQLVNAPGGVCWNELMTPDTDKVTGFYQHMFGWTYETKNMGPEFGNYVIVNHKGHQAGGMMPWDKPPAPPHWLAYIAVEDCDKTAARVAELGGTIMAPPMDIPHVGRFAVARDPQGAHFAFIKQTPR